MFGRSYLYRRRLHVANQLWPSGPLTAIYRTAMSCSRVLSVNRVLHKTVTLLRSNSSSIGRTPNKCVIAAEAVFLGNDCILTSISLCKRYAKTSDWVLDKNIDHAGNHIYLPKMRGNNRIQYRPAIGTSNHHIVHCVPTQMTFFRISKS